MPFIIYVYWICYVNYVTDCLWRAQAQSVWDFPGWSSERRGSCLQEDPTESWGCARKECPHKLLGGHSMTVSLFFLITCKRGKLGFLIFFNNFREWTLQQTSWGLWCASGRHWLRLMWMLRQQITTPWGCSALHSQRSVKTRTRRLHMPNPVRSVRFSWNSIQLLSFPCGLTLQWCW